VVGFSGEKVKSATGDLFVGSPGALATEFSALGVPLILLPSASKPFIFEPLLVAQFSKVSGAKGSILSIVAKGGLPSGPVPAGQLPPSLLAVSMIFPLASRKVRASPELDKPPE